MPTISSTNTLQVGDGALQSEHSVKHSEIINDDGIVDIVYHQEDGDDVHQENATEKASALRVNSISSRSLTKHSHLDAGNKAQHQKTITITQTVTIPSLYEKPLPALPD